MSPHPDVAVLVGYDRSTEDHRPVWDRDCQWRHKNGAGVVGSGLDHEAIEQSGWWERIEDLALAVAAEGASGAVPVSDGKGILGLGPWLRVAGEEARQQRVGLGSEGVIRDSEIPAEGLSQQQSTVTDQ